ncbi:MAG: flagellar basal-body rod protein FlgF [Pseudomonadota bacterium]|nr:flagellar basal-body rod protein FlgF [Pseudomonadota bacterium]
MDKVLYLASSAGKEIMFAQTQNANNLANANTIGFKEDLAYAKSLPVYGPGLDSRVYTITEGKSSDVTSGSLMTTGRELDVAINGKGWFAVQGLDGTEGYTRAGDLRVTPSGMLTTAAGHPVFGNSGAPITIPPYEKLEVGTDGTISIRPIGQAPATLAVVDRIKMVQPDETKISKSEDGLFRMSDGTTAVADARVSMVSGVLETSNVNVVSSMVSMMELAKKFEMQIKVMEKANELDTASQQIMKLS